MIDVVNVNKNYNKQEVLKNVSFSLKKGEIVGFLGPNGAGKSTMMKILMGYILPDSGCVKIDNINVEDDFIKTQKISGYLPENNPLYLDMYVREYLSYVCDLRKIDNRVDEVINLIGLSKEKHKKIKQLSKGYRQRVGLAQAIIHDPKVLILDEPTTGLDPNQLVEIRNIIKEIGKNKTILFSTHIMQEVEAICDRVIIIDRGKIVVDKRIDEINNQKTQTILVEFDLKLEKEYISRNLDILEVENVRDSYWRVTFDRGSRDNIECIYNFADNNKLKILQINVENKSLEQIFNSYTK